jgi:outer membrane immunogenic protein
MFRASLPPVLAPVLALGLIAGLTAHGAKAADYLRGSYAGEAAPRAVAAESDWAGFYVGAHAGVSSVHNKPGALSAPSVTMPTGWTGPLPTAISSFGNTSKNGMSYGAFAGVNYLWDDVVLGLEADYTHSNIKADRRVGPTTTTAGTATLVNTQSVAARPTDWGTARVRIGWAAGMFMPFVTAGVAVGNVDTRTANYGTYSDPGAVPTPLSGAYSATGSRNGMMFGAAYGAGVDMQIVPNTFLRAEWQGVQFARTTSGTTQRPEIMINTARVAGGVKF